MTIKFFDLHHKIRSALKAKQAKIVHQTTRNMFDNSVNLFRGIQHSDRKKSESEQSNQNKNKINNVEM